MSDFINVMVTDDHRMMREGLRQLLEVDGDIKVVAEAADGIECLSMLESSRPDVILLDINMPRLDGMTTLKRIRESYPDQKVILVTIHNEVEYLYKAYNIGVNGYVLKDSGSVALKKAIRVVNDGGLYIEPVLIPALKDRLESKDNKEEELELLTKREFQILKLVAQGLYNKEIADVLGVTEKTVKNHITSLFKKIDVNDRTQAAVYAIKNGYVKMD